MTAAPFPLDVGSGLAAVEPAAAVAPVLARSLALSWAEAAMRPGCTVPTVLGLDAVGLSQVFLA